MIFSAISLLVIFIILCSGSALCCALGKGQFEDALPLTCTGIVAIGFFFGVFGLLLPGFFCTLALAAVFIAVALWTAAKKGFEDFCRNFFTPGFFIFSALYLALFVFNYGMRLCAWDEFSHWGDIVKVMTTLHGFGTHPLSESLFPNYPPAMALFQFFCEEIYMHISGDKMAEWLLYFSYQVFMLSLYFPFIKNLDIKKFSSWVVIAVIWLIPMIFQNNAYATIYIDSFLSALLGTGLAHVLVECEPDTTGRLNLAAILFLLPITKGIGLPLAAVLLAAVYVLEHEERKKNIRRRERMIYTAAVLVPWAMWQLHLKVFHAARAVGPSSEIAAEHIGDSRYALGILKNYLMAMVQRPITNKEAVFPNLPPLVVLALLILVLWRLLQNGEKFLGGDRVYERAFAIVLSANILFFVGTGVGFMYFFPEDEAVMLLGIERYLNNILMADTILALLLIADLLNRGVMKEKKITAALIVLAILFTPVMPTARFVLRRDVLATQKVHSQYEPYYEVLSELTIGQRASILFAADSIDSYSLMLLHTELRPNHMEMAPLPENLDRYDYVVMYDVDTPPEGTENGGIYAVSGDELIRVN